MRILLADDHALFRDGVASLLAAWGHEVVGVAADGDGAVELADRLRPDLVLMDVRMPGGGGIEATVRLAAHHPEIPIVMLTASEDEDDLFTAIKAGCPRLPAQGPRGAAAARDARGGGARRGSHLAGDGGADPRRGRPPDHPDRGSRERGSRAGAGSPDRARGGGPPARGGRPPEQGDRRADLGISENTTKFHLRNILEKLHAGSRTEVAARAVREGLVPDR